MQLVIVANADLQVQQPSNDPDVFWVSQIQDYKRDGNDKMLYRVRWWGFGANMDTWECADNLPDGAHTYKWASKKRQAACACFLANQKA